MSALRPVDGPINEYDDDPKPRTLRMTYTIQGWHCVPIHPGPGGHVHAIELAVRGLVGLSSVDPRSVTFEVLEG